MNLQDAKTLAIDLMKKHGLIQDDVQGYTPSSNWTFAFNNRFTSALGRCSYGRKLIELGTKYVELNNEERVRKTILHEIAHSLTQGCGHNWEWKRMCIAIGGDGKTRADHNEIVSTPRRRTNKRKPRTEYINVKGVSVVKGKELTLMNGQKCTFEKYEPNNRKYKFLVKVCGMIYKVSEEQIKF